jgi:hypothetical protein
MSYNGSGTFNINTTGQPVVAGTIISAATFNALTADLATGLTTALTKDGQTTATARIPFAQGITSTLVTDASSVSTGSIITAGGVGIAKKLYVGTDANIAGNAAVTGTLGVTGVATFSAAPIYSSLTASSAVATDASKALVSVTNTGTGSNVLATGPTIASLNLTTALTLASAAGTNGQVLTSAGSGLPTWTTPGVAGFTIGTPVDTSTGTLTSVDYTGIPSGTRQITISFVGVGTDTSSILVQIGDAGGIETTDYVSRSFRAVNGGSGVGASATNGFIVYLVLTSNAFYGQMVLMLENNSTNTWVGAHSGTATTSSSSCGGGSKSLSQTLDRLRITTVNGTDLFDAGEVNIAYI